ncbi:site-specific integrase [Cytobacillus spongiae]|uniref:site-specific integrase n=1 Tax=Cytobacillus spongiae TaxID=2901381 RepID=UPI001F1DDEAF|nr:tyrosine-type recombinase/integrase [Cytobacillus spongiae]UII57063.1 site-specific integrase [Cytobacillus spongiae]
MGQVKKDGSSWYFVAELPKDPITGKRKRKKQRGFKTKREAEKALAQVEAEVIRGTYIEPTNTLYKDYLLLEWFRGKKATINSQTAKSYENYMNHRIIPKLGHIPLSQLNVMVLQNYIYSLKEDGLASATIKKIYNIIRNSLEHAKTLELLAKNPATNIQLPKIEKTEMTVWNVEESKAFLHIAREDRLYVAFHLAITTGMRQGEILGLRWKYVDLEKGVIRICQTLSHDGKEFLVGAKTASSVRSIKLPDETIVLLRKHKAVIARERLQVGQEYVDHDPVICTSKGTPILPANLRRTYARLIKQADVPAIRFHDLRHTHATLLLSQGVHAKVISERLGHSNIKTTLDIYSHVLPNMQDEAAKQINNLLSNSQ